MYSGSGDDSLESRLILLVEELEFEFSSDSFSEILRRSGSWKPVKSFTYWRVREET